MTSSTLPVPFCGPQIRNEFRGDCLRLHAVGFALPRLSPIERCALTAPFHPYWGELSVFGNRFRLEHRLKTDN
jgi:hypothetical protein